MNLLVFGKTGQVARELARIAPGATFLARDRADLSRPDTLPHAIVAHAPDAVINAAAYTAVDRAETDEALATVVNGAAPAAMARTCADLGIPLVHISSDYVLDGSGGAPRAPDAAPAPVNAYGRSKLAGEAGVAGAGGPHAILRTSWVFSAHGANFVRTMLRLGAERDTVSVVDDQVGGPTPAADIAAACLAVAAGLGADPARSGIYHLAGAPDVSWAGFARAIFAAAGLECHVTGIATADYPTPARRPLNSRLDCTSVQRVFGIARPDWHAGLRRTIDELRARRT